MGRKRVADMTEEERERAREASRKRYAANLEKARESARKSARKRREANPEKVREYERKRRAANPEKEREYARAFRAANREKVREADRKWKAANREKAREASRKRYRKSRTANPEKLLLRSAKERAKKKGLPFNIEASDIHITECCPLCTNPMVALTPLAPSVDRIVPALGYVKGNVVVVCRACNHSKLTMTGALNAARVSLMRKALAKEARRLQASKKTDGAPQLALFEGTEEAAE